MEITCDEVKRQSNLSKHGYDFAELDLAFFERATILSGHHGRLLDVGQFDDTIVSVIFRPLGSEALSVISMRDASFKERRLAR
ncbi:MAG TPA: BrnT family toxin [Devosia sp.]|nr:BrnT family toxin [Devosia sp.]